MKIIIVIALIFIVYKVVSSRKSISQMSNADAKVSQQSAMLRQPIKRSNPHRILICDDATFMRIMLKNVLTQNGYEVIAEAGDGLEAIERYYEFKPDLVFMDTTMPKMDGIDATITIKEMESDANIVICGAMGQQELVMEAIRAGAINFIVKPFSQERILKTMAEIEPRLNNLYANRTIKRIKPIYRDRTANITPEQTATSPVQEQRTQINSYQNLLEEYYRKYKDQVFQNRTLSEIQQKINFERSLSEIKHDMKIIRNKIILLNKTATPSTQSHSKQTQTTSTESLVQAQSKQVRTEDTEPPQSILDTQKLFNHVKAMPVKWGYANPNVTPIKELQQLCSSFLTSWEIPKCYSPDSIQGMEYIIQKKRARTPDKADYNKVMETNMLFELYEYSYYMNIFKVLTERKNDTVKINMSELRDFIHEDCHKRLENLEYEKRNNPAIQDMLQKYKYDNQKVAMVVNDYVEGREYDYIYAYLRTSTLMNIVNYILNTEIETAKGYQPTLQVVRQYPSSDLTAALDTYISSFIGMALNSYTNGGSIPRKPQ